MNIYVIVGPTGVGKSSVAVELAKQINAEIISGDAYQVYRQMEIGTAKITEEEMDGIPHHLLNCMDMEEEYNVREFQRLARNCMEEILSRGKKVIVCGGTGLYIKALLYDYVFQDQKVNKELRDELTLMDKAQLYAMLEELDEESAKVIHPNNKQRILRAIELAKSGIKKSEEEKKQEHKMLYDAVVVGLTMERSKLYERINDRVEEMMKEGLLKEVQQLENAGYSWDLQSLQTIGYKEWKDYFQQTNSLEDVVDKIKQDTRNFAKRQYTWFRNQMDVYWIDVEDKTKQEIVEEILNIKKEDVHEG